LLWSFEGFDGNWALLEGTNVTTVSFDQSCGGPTCNDPLILPINFDCDGTDYISKSSTEPGTTFSVVDNPEQGGIHNVATKVGQIVNGGAAFDNVKLSLDQAIDLSTQKRITLKLYSSQSLPVLLKLENSPSDFDEVEVTHGGSGWEELVFDFSSSSSFDDLVLFVAFNQTTTGTFYLDDIEQSNIPLTNADLAGDWKLEPVPGALAVGPERGSGAFFSINASQVIERDCLFDDIWTFGEGGSLSLDQQNETWLEPWQGTNPEACGTPVTPHDGSGTYSYSLGDGTLTVNGAGMYLGLAKVFNGGELTTPGDAAASITYQITEFTEESGVKRLTLDIQVGGGNWWRFKLASGEIKPRPTFPITFENAANVDYEFSDFETNVSQLVANPNTTGNSSANVMQMVKSNGAVFAGTNLPLSAPIDFGTNTVVRVKVLSPRVGARLALKLEGSNNGEIEKATTLANEWETLDFNFVGMTDADYSGVTLIWDNGIAGGGGADWTFYLDDFEIVETPAEDLVAFPLDFESGTLNYQASVFGGNAGGVIDNPVSGGINTTSKVLELTKTSGAVVFAGTAIPLGVPIDFDGKTSIRLKAYSPRVGETITLKLEGADRNPNVDGVQGAEAERDATTTVAGQWEELTFDFLGATGAEYVQPVLFWDFGETGLGETVYIDDLEVIETPAEQLIELPLDFESSTLNYAFNDFNGGQTSVIANPQSNGSNTSGFVLETKKGFGIDAGTTLFLSSPIDFGQGTKMRMQVYSPRVGVPLTFVLGAQSGDAAARILSTTQANTWETLEFDFADDLRSDYVRMTLIWDNGTSGDAGADWTFLVDDIDVFFVDPVADPSLSDLKVDGVSVDGFNSGTLEYDVELVEGTMVVPTVTASATNTNLPSENIVITPGSLPFPTTTTIAVTSQDNSDNRTYKINFTVENPTTAPTAAASTPLNLEVNVVSVFSNTYTDLGSTNFAEFGAANFEEVTVADSKKVLRYYENESAGEGKFRGVQLGSAVDADGNSLSRVRFDVWFSKDLDPDSEFVFKVVDGVFPNNTDGEIRITPSSDPEMIQGQWLTYDFSLASLTAFGGNTPDNITQLVIDLVNAREVYLDNIIFYDPVPIAPTAAPAEPSFDAGNVIAVWSDNYGDRVGTRFRDNGAADVDTLNLNGNNVLRYAKADTDGGNFAIIEMGGDNQIDMIASGMTNLRFDMWFSNEVTPESFVLFNTVNIGVPVSQTTTRISEDFDPSMKQGQWITFDFSIEELIELGMNGFSNIQQFVVDVNFGPEVYIDNLLFYKKEIPLQNDATLSGIQVDTQPIEGFNPALFDYSFELPAGTTQIPTVTATTTAPGAGAVPNAASALPGTTSIVVTAEDGVTQLTYNVKFFVDTPPNAAPAAPTEDAANVLAIYSDSYETVPNQGIDNYGAAVIDTVTFVDNDVLRYTLAANSFQVIELGEAGALDLFAAGITNFSFDVWFSKDITDASRFLVKLEQFAGTRNTGTLQLLSTSQPSMAQGQWITYDIPLTDLNNLTSVQQIVIDLQNVGQAFIDNIYFYGDGPPSTENLLTNGDFEDGTTAWATNFGDNTPDVRTEGGNSFFFSNVESAGNSFDVNLSQTGLSISPNGDYTLRFTASTSDGETRTVVAGIGLSGSPFNSDTEVVTITSIPTEYSLSLTAFGPGEFGAGAFGGDGNSRVLFDLGADIGVAVIDDVSLQIGANIPSSLATLNDLKVNGESIDGFNPATEIYQVELPFSTTELPVVTASTTSGSAVIDDTQADVIDGMATIQVTAEDGETTKTYTIDFSIGDPSDDATLSDLKIGDNTVDEFAADKFDYMATLPSGSTLETIPAITATTSDENAQDPVINTELNTVDENIFATTTIVVTAEDGEATESYKIDFSIATEAGDATLSDLQVDFGTAAQPDFQTVEGFDPVTLNYDVALPFGTDPGAVPAVQATPTFEGLPDVTDDGATVAIVDASGLPGTTTITVTSEDESNTQDYKIAFTIAEASKDSVLTAITVGGNAVNGFDPQTFTYSLVLPANTNTIPAVVGTPSDANAQVVVTTSAVAPGLATIVVTAQNGTSVSTYTVKMSVANDPNLVTNGNFEFGQESWAGNAFNVQTEGGNSFNFADIAQAGQSFDVSLRQTGLQLQTDEFYTLAFNASTSTGQTRSLVVGIGPVANPANSQAREVVLTGTDTRFSIVIPASFAAGTDDRIFFDMGAATGVVVIDNVSLTPAESISFPVTFEEDDVAYAFTEFGGAPGTVEDNPSPSGINTSDRVAQTEKVGGAEAGTFFEMDAPIDFSAGKVVFMKVYSPKANINVRLRLENSTNNTIGFELVESVASANQWVELSYDFTDLITNEFLSKVVLVFDPENAGDGSKFFWDDISLVSPRADATLSSITVDDEPIDDFEGSTLNWEVEIPFGTTKIPVVAATANSVGADVEITQAPNLADSAKIVVTSIDQNNTNTYYVKFKIGAPSEDATLTDIKVDDVSIPGFKADSLTYTIELPSGTQNIPQITEVTVSNDSATFVIEQATDLPDTARVVVTAQSDTIKLTYQVIFKELDANQDATLSEITYGDDDVLIPGFSPIDTAYMVQLPFGSTAPIVKAKASNDSDDVSVDITQITELPGRVTIVVTAADEVTKKTYIVDFSAPNTDATLSDLRLGTETIDGFLPEVLLYNVTLPFSAQDIPATTATANDVEGATVDIKLAQTVEDSTFVVVTAEDGMTVKTYTIAFEVADPGTDATLKELLVDGNLVSGFEPSKFDYTIVLSEGTTIVPAVDAVLTDENAQLAITQASALDVAALISVTSEDGQMTNEYRVVFEVSDNKAPIVTAPLIDRSMELNNTITVDLSNNFADPENLQLTYSFTNLRDEVLTVSIDGTVMTITAISIGTSTIEVTAKDDINGTATATLDITVVGSDVEILHDIAGSATADGNPFTQGRAVMFDVDNINNVFSSDLTPNGGFAFSFVPTGNYYLYVTSESPDYVTTVYGDVSTVIDPDAPVAILEVNTTIGGLKIAMVDKPTPALQFLDKETGGTLNFNTRSVTGGGSRVLEGNNTDGEVLSGVVVILQTQQGEYIADGVTDENGYVQFIGLPTGDYNLIVDVPGVGRVTSEVSVEEGRQAYYTGLIDGDNIGINIATGIDDELLNAILLYPSTVERDLYIDMPAPILEQFELSITSMSGRQIIPNFEIENARIMVRVDQLSQGLHVVMISTRNGTWSGKFIKR